MLHCERCIEMQPISWTCPTASSRYATTLPIHIMHSRHTFTSSRSAPHVSDHDDLYLDVPGKTTVEAMSCRFAARYFFSISVENLTVPSSKISTRGAVPRMPNVPTGVSTFMSPVCATFPAMKLKVPLVRLTRLEFE
jgi:hypothetical protein